MIARTNFSEFSERWLIALTIRLFVIHTLLMEYRGSSYVNYIQIRRRTTMIELLMPYFFQTCKNIVDTRRKHGKKRKMDFSSGKHIVPISMRINRTWKILCGIFSCDYLFLMYNLLGMFTCGVWKRVSAVCIRIQIYIFTFVD